MTPELMQEGHSESPSSCATLRLQDARVCDMDLPYRKSIYPLGYSVEIVTNEPAVLAAAEQSFGHVRSSRQTTPLQIRVGVTHQERAILPPEPERHAFAHLFSLVADAHNQSLLDLNTGQNFTWITRTTLENCLYFRTNFLEKAVYLLLGASVVTDLHAACVSRNDRGILLCGRSGAGKSTLAYACARQGWTYTSDDTSYLINSAVNPRVIGHCHRARFRPEARSLFPELADRAITPRMECKPSIEVPIADLPVGSATPEAEIHAIVFLDRHPDGVCRFLRLRRGTATERMRHELYSTGEIRARHEETLEIFSDIPAFELQYCKLNDGIEALESLISRI
ncbi:MAG: HPr kinase/phosphorylase [Terracidiphilus sp.]